MTDIYICGDSISAAYDPVSTLFTGWGQVLGAFLPGARILGGPPGQALPDGRGQPDADPVRAQ